MIENVVSSPVTHWGRVAYLRYLTGSPLGQVDTIFVSDHELASNSLSETIELY